MITCRAEPEALQVSCEEANFELTFAPSTPPPPPTPPQALRQVVRGDGVEVEEAVEAIAKQKRIAVASNPQ